MSEECLNSRVLAEFVVESKFDDVPREMVEKMQRHILDSVGAGVAGAISKEVHILRKTLEEAGEGSGKAVLWGGGASMSPLNAALVNGTASHAFELDDTGGCDHSGAVVVPAAFAAVDLLAGERRIDGREFIMAVLLGYDVARRALEACGAYEPHNERGFHSTGTCGTFGAAAAAARILGLDVEKTQMALGLASSFSAGLWACVHDGAQNKRLHAGHAAYGGLMSALLARSGFTGPSKIFETVWGGFSHSFALESEAPEAWTKDLGRPWKLHRVSIKPHASCRSTHSSIDAVDNLRRRRGFAAEDVEKIEVVINSFVLGMCGGRGIDPMNSAQLSIPYSVAADLVFGNASLASFAAGRRRDPRVADMMSRIVMIEDKAQAPDEEPLVRVFLKTGEVLEEHVPMPLGSPVNPVDDEALLSKFKSVSSMVLPKDVVDALADKLMNLEKAADVCGEVSKLLASKPSSTEVFDA